MPVVWAQAKSASALPTALVCHLTDKHANRLARVLVPPIGQHWLVLELVLERCLELVLGWRLRLQQLSRKCHRMLLLLPRILGYLLLLCLLRLLLLPRW